MPVFDPEPFVSGSLCDRRLLESALEGGTRELRVLDAVLVACVFVESWNAMRCDAMRLHGLFVW